MLTVENLITMRNQGRLDTENLEYYYNSPVDMVLFLLEEYENKEEELREKDLEIDDYLETIDELETDLANLKLEICQLKEKANE